MREKRLVRAALVILLAVCVTMLALAGGAQEPKKAAGGAAKAATITVQMFSGPEFDAMVPTAEYWNKNYAAKTGITVNAVALSRVGYFEKMQSQLVAGLAEPDLVHPFNMQLGKLAPYLEPLNKYLSDPAIMSGPNGEKYTVDEALKVGMDTVTGPDGSIYGLPKDMSEIAMYYRKDLITSVPQTWDEFIAVAKKFTKSINAGSPVEYGAVLQGKYEKWTYCSALEALWPNGYDIFKAGSNNKEIAEYDAKWAKGFKPYEELGKAKALYPGFDNTEYPEVSAAMESGNVALAMQWNANYYSITNKDVSPKVWDKITIAEMPGEKQADGSIKKAMYVQTINLSLNKASKNKEAAMKFLAWSVFGEGAVLYAKAGGSSPVKSVWTTADAAMPYPVLAPLVEKYGRALPQHDDMSELVMIGSSWVQKVGIGKATAAEGVKGMRDEMAAYLKTR